MSLHFQANVRPTNAGLGNRMASTAIPPLSRPCQMPSQCVSSCQSAVLLPSLQTRRQANPCSFTSQHCNKRLRCQHLSSCQASVVGQSSMASQPESPNRMGFWSRVHAHRWTPSLLRNCIKTAQTWTPADGPSVKDLVSDALRMPLQPEMNYPSWSDLVWKSSAVLVAIVVLMVVVCTIDSGFLYFLVKLMRRHA